MCNELASWEKLEWGVSEDRNLDAFKAAEALTAHSGADVRHAVAGARPPCAMRLNEARQHAVNLEKFE